MLSVELLKAVPERVEGVQERPPLLFLHGAFAGAWCWAENFMPYFLSQGRAVYALSFRGHAGSDGLHSLNNFGINDYVSDVQGILEDIDQPPLVVGHSMGGFVAMKLAEKHDLAGLALLSSVPPSGLLLASANMAFLNPSLIMEIALVQSGRPDGMTHEGLKKAMFHGPNADRDAQKYLPRMGPESQRAFADMHGLMRAFPSKINGRMPVCVMSGEEDQLISPSFVKSTAYEFKTQPIMLKNMGHGLMLGDGWEDAAQSLAQWLVQNDI